jgi:ABC-type enterochelin transport system permease subunit
VTLLCIFAVAKFVRQSLEMHKALKQWRSDRYMKLLVRESILYFIAYALLFFAALTLTQFSPTSNMGEEAAEGASA